MLLSCDNFADAGGFGGKDGADTARWAEYDPIGG